MARPKKEKELAYTHHLHLRLTETEYEIAAETARLAKLTLSEFTRKQLTNKQVTVKYEIVADVPEIKKLIAEFSKIGGNLNQIARHFNQGGTKSQEIETSLYQCLSDIYEMKFEVLKMVGDFSNVRQRTDETASGGNVHGDTETHSS